MTLLDMTDVTIEYEITGEHGSQSTVQAVTDASLSVDEGKMVGLVGESGCGKTTLMKSILGLLDSNGTVTAGGICYQGDDLLEFGEKELNRHVRWKEISYIPQNAMASLDPVYTVGYQIKQVLRCHEDFSKQEVTERTEDILRKVELEPQIASKYPHQLSGGQRQRVVIALALVLAPNLIIADEPTTGLDVIVQRAIIKLLHRIQDEFDCSILMVTHDISLVAEVTDEVFVMYGGQVMEAGPTDQVFTRCAHPYTIGLQNSFADLDPAPDISSLISIPGSPPDLNPPPSGCRFTSRCPFASDECEDIEPSTEEVAPNHLVKCHYPERDEEFRTKGGQSNTWL